MLVPPSCLELCKGSVRGSCFEASRRPLSLYICIHKHLYIYRERESPKISERCFTQSSLDLDLGYNLSKAGCRATGAYHSCPDEAAVEFSGAASQEFSLDT